MWSHVPSAPRSLLRQAAPAYLPALTPPGFSLPITGPQCPWPVEGLPSHGDRQGEHRALGEQAHGVQALKLMTTAVLPPAPPPINSLFPPGMILPMHCHKQILDILTLGSKDLSLLLYIIVAPERGMRMGCPSSRRSRDSYGMTAGPDASCCPGVAPEGLWEPRPSPTPTRSILPSPSHRWRIAGSSRAAVGFAPP